jgi:hypothetical protein
MEGKNFDAFKSELEEKYNDPTVVSGCCDWCDWTYIRDNPKFSVEEKELSESHFHESDCSAKRNNRLGKAEHIKALQLMKPRPYSFVKSVYTL